MEDTSWYLPLDTCENIQHTEKITGKYGFHLPVEKDTHIWHLQTHIDIKTNSDMYIKHKPRYTYGHTQTQKHIYLVCILPEPQVFITGKVKTVIQTLSISDNKSKYAVLTNSYIPSRKIIL